MNETKTHPLIREVQLGKPLQSLCDELYEDVDFEALEQTDDFDKIIRKLIELNNPRAKFGVVVKENDCFVTLLNDDWTANLEVHYWDDDDNFAKSDEAEYDAQQLNQIVEKIFGKPKVRPKKKMTKSEFLKKKGDCCPHCHQSDTWVLDDFITFRTERTMACAKCGGTWIESYEMKLKGYE